MTNRQMINYWTGWKSFLAAGALGLAIASPAAAEVLYSNGFEVDTAGWTAFSPGFHPTRVTSGTNGITSASGSFHAVSSPTGSAGNWGGYNFGAGSVPTTFQGYRTSIDIYLDTSGSSANDARFDFDSAISNAAGGFARDFIFNGGFYNTLDLTGPGAGTNRFVISASNNSQPGSAFAKNPAGDPIAIATTGWYTFEHEFYNDGGVLAVDMTIYDASDAIVHSWTLSNPADLIGGIGGNRYGWFTANQFSVLAFDNASLEVPEPATLVLFALGLAGISLARRRRTGP